MRIYNGTLCFVIFRQCILHFRQSHDGEDEIQEATSQIAMLKRILRHQEMEMEKFQKENPEVIINIFC